MGRSPGIEVYEPGKLAKSPFWYVRGTYLKVSVFKSTGARTRSNAERFKRKIEREIEDGCYQSRPRKRPTFADAAVIYLESCPKAEVPYVRRLVRYWKDTPLEDINQAAIGQCIKDIYPPGPDPEPTPRNSTINRLLLTQLSAVLNKAAKHELCGYMRIERLPMPKGRVRFAEPEEAEEIIEEGYRTYLDMGAMLIFLFYTGARVGEALKLEWPDVSLEHRHCILRDTKNGETYGCAINKRAWLALANLPHRDGPVFRFTDYPQAEWMLRGVRSRSGAEDFTFHCCRHTFATWAIRSGAGTKKLMEAGRWKDEKSCLRYQHVTSHEIRDLVERLPGSGESVNFSDGKNKESQEQ